MRNSIDPKKRIQGPGLTKAGIVVFQSFLIALFAAIEIFIRGKVGAVTGFSLWLAYFGAIYLGRKGTIFVSVVTPPIVFAISIIILLPSVGGSALRLSRFGLDLVSGLAAIAPFLVSAAFIGWILYFAKERRD
jgi:hypothetical protein